MHSIQLMSNILSGLQIRITDALINKPPNQLTYQLVATQSYQLNISPVGKKLISK